VRCRPLITSLTLLLSSALFAGDAAGALKTHAIFSSHMVIQRDKPIKIWGWAKPGQTVTVKLGKETAEAKVQPEAPVEVFGLAEDYAGLGRWEVTFRSREASAEPTTLVVTGDDQKLVLEDILIGDVWVMSGQSNMAFPLGKVHGGDMESAQAHLPMLRLFSIQGNEQGTLQDDIRPETITTGGWVASSPETAREVSAIGYVFGSIIQRALQIPIGVIKNARGGASIESIVPAHKFDEDPLAKRYADYIRQRMEEFDPKAEADSMWEAAKARAKRKNLPKPERPDPKNLRSWNVPGKSPSDMGSVHNGMFGAFKGFNIKGVLFQQGFNNTLGDNCRPKRYRVLMKLMVEGWREDFEDPNLPVGVIGFCADGKLSQNEENFEAKSNASGPYIREAQRLGLADVGDPEHTVFIPAYDVQSPGLHPKKKREHGWRAARWALSEVYCVKGISWLTAGLVSAERRGDVMVLTFDGRVHPDDGSSIPRGFSIAGEDGKFYMAHARYQSWEKSDYWTKGHRTIHVWSPLVEKPVAVRYGWATSPMGNLKCNGYEHTPFPSFRTDDWDFPESDDPEVSLAGSAEGKARKEETAERLEYRRTEEAKRAVEVIERIKTLGQQDAAEGS